jgi:hypothetical protein
LLKNQWLTPTAWRRNLVYEGNFFLVAQAFSLGKALSNASAIESQELLEMAGAPLLPMRSHKIKGSPSWAFGAPANYEKFLALAGGRPFFEL